MKITAFSLRQEHYLVMSELYAKLMREFKDDADLVQGCLCNTRNLTGLEVIIAHPEYDNKKGCWSRIKNLVESNPETQFYLFAIDSPERKKFFGEYPNLKYIDNRNIKKICENAAVYFKAKK